MAGCNNAALSLCTLVTTCLVTLGNHYKALSTIPFQVEFCLMFVLIFTQLHKRKNTEYDSSCPCFFDVMLLVQKLLCRDNIMAGQ